MEYGLHHRLPLPAIGLFGNDETGQIRRERIGHGIADQNARPRAVQPREVEPFAKCGNLAGVLIHGDHVQGRLPHKFFDQTAAVDPQHQGVTVANARGCQGWPWPVRSTRLPKAARPQSPRAWSLRRPLGAAKARMLPLGRHDEQLLVGGQHSSRRAFELRTPDDLGFLARGRVDGFHNSRPADIQVPSGLDVNGELRRQFPKLTKDAAEIVRNLVLGAVRRDVVLGSFLKRVLPSDRGPRCLRRSRTSLRASAPAAERSRVPVDWPVRCPAGSIRPGTAWA